MADALKIGIAGLGTVGASLVRILQDRHEMLATTCGRAIETTAVTARDRNRDRGVDLSKTAWFDDAISLARDADIDVFVELMGGAGDPAYSAVKAALQRGIHVVTANKALLAAHGIELAKIAEEKGALLNYEAAVAGGIPVIKALRESMTGNTISRVYGIMNGTCNYILTKMEKEQLSFEACLKEAQRLGYAEADPAFDIEGNDTAHKLSILTSLAFGTAIAADDIYLEGITNISIDDIHAAADLGYRIKLLGVAQRTESGIEQRVHPTMVPYDSVIAQVDGVTNAVAIESDILGELLMVGPGAQHVPAFGRPTNALLPYKRAQIQSHEGGYFIRLKVVDRTGVFASIATRMADNGISLESIMQHSKHLMDTGEPQTIILVTHATSEHSVRDAIKAIKGEGYLVGEPQVIRIERPKAN
jgi:homoserine dehydrogenase